MQDFFPGGFAPVLLGTLDPKHISDEHFRGFSWTVLFRILHDAAKSKHPLGSHVSLRLPCNSGAKDRCPEWPTPPKFNSSPLKNDGWEMILSSWGRVYFQGRTVSFREGSIFGFSSSRNELIFYPLESSILTRPKIFRQQSLGVGMEIPYR